MTIGVEHLAQGSSTFELVDGTKRSISEVTPKNRIRKVGDVRHRKGRCSVRTVAKASQANLAWICSNGSPCAIPGHAVLVIPTGATDRDSSTHLAMIRDHCNTRRQLKFSAATKHRRKSDRYANSRSHSPHSPSRRRSRTSFRRCSGRSKRRSGSFRPPPS